VLAPPAVRDVGANRNAGMPLVIRAKGVVQDVLIASFWAWIKSPAPSASPLKTGLSQALWFYCRSAARQDQQLLAVMESYS